MGGRNSGDLWNYKMVSTGAGGTIPGATFRSGQGGLPLSIARPGKALAVMSGARPA